MKATKCINCGSIPEIVDSGENHQPFLLRHKESVICYPSYKLESFQKTTDACIESWNKFNKPFTNR